MRNNKLKLFTLMLLLLTLASTSFANEYIHRDFEREYYLGDVIEIRIGLNAQTKVDIAEYVPLSTQIVNWTTSPNVKVERRIIGDKQVIWFDISEGQTHITYSLIPRYVGEHEIRSIITTPKGFEKEIMRFEVKRKVNINPLLWFLGVLSLILFVDLVEKESVKNK